MRCLAVSLPRDRDIETVAGKIETGLRQWPRQQTLSHWRIAFCSEAPPETVSETPRLAAVSQPEAPPRQHSESVSGSYLNVFTALQDRCPEQVEAPDWRQAIADGHRFLAHWGGQAEVLGWTSRDLFGLHKPPDKLAPTYRRLSRYDETGLIWLLRSRPVVVLTEAIAAIENPTGNVTVYRRYNKPGLGPVGDSLDELE